MSVFHDLHCFLFIQDRLTFRRIIVKNNAKKRRLYEAFIETLPLLTSLEVKTVLDLELPKPTMHLDWTQCNVLLPADIRENEGGRCPLHQGVQRFTANYCSGEAYFPYLLIFCFLLCLDTGFGSLHKNLPSFQGDLADCFYIVESGQVRITMKRSRVCSCSCNTVYRSMMV